MSTETQRPWYREFWLWFVFAPPMASVALGLSLLATAVIKGDSMVVDDYYAVGRALHRTQDKERTAVDMGVDGRVMLDREYGQITVLLEGLEDPPQQILLQLSHATHASRDVTMELERDASGLYRGDARQPLIGRHYLRLQPTEGGWLVAREVDAETREVSLHADQAPET